MDILPIWSMKMAMNWNLILWRGDTSACTSIVMQTNKSREERRQTETRRKDEVDNDI